MSIRSLSFATRRVGRASRWFRLSLAAVLALAFAPPANAATALRGDVDRDGRVDSADAILVLRYTVGLAALDADQKRLADANMDGKVDTLDVLLILQRTVGLVKDLGVVDFPPESATITTAVQGNETVFLWPKTGKTTAELIFTQGGLPPIRLSTTIEEVNGQDAFRLKKLIDRVAPGNEGRIGNEYTFFQGFTSDPVHVDVLVSDSSTGGFTEVGKTTVQPLVHVFDPGFFGDAAPEIALQSTFPDTAKVGDTVRLSGKVTYLYGLRADGYLIPPGGIPIKIGMQSDTPIDSGGGLGPRINTGSDFSLQFKIDAPGPYVVEVNDYTGAAALSRPIYVGGGVPLLPGPLDFQTQTVPNPPPVDLNKLRSDWMGLLNKDRVAFGLKPVEVDDLLTASGQGHTDDMAAKNYFGHIGLDGSDPTSRAIRAGVPINDLIGENLSQGVTVEEMEHALMASGLHRSILLNPDWKRVGFGISRYSNGLLFGAQEFAVGAGEYSLPVDYFAGVTLDQPLSTAFQAGRTTTVSGKVADADKSLVIFFQNTASGKQAVFPASAVSPDANGRFSIDVSFLPEQAGTYQIGISVNGGASNSAIVVVNASAP